MPEGLGYREVSCLRVSISEFNGRSEMMYHATKHTIAAARRRVPKPPKSHSSTFRSKCRFGGETTFFPYICARLWTCAESNPTLGDTESRWRASSIEILCQSRDAISVEIIVNMRIGRLRESRTFDVVPPTRIISIARKIEIRFRVDMNT